MDDFELGHPSIELDILRAMLDQVVAAYLFMGKEIKVPFSVVDSLLGFSYILGLNVNENTQEVKVILTDLSKQDGDSNL